MSFIDEKQIHTLNKNVCNKLEGDMYGTCNNAIAIILEINRWEGKKEPIMRHGYLAEKMGKISRQYKEWFKD